MSKERKCPVSKEALNEYYSVPWVRDAIFNQCADRFVCVRFDWGMVRHPTKVEAGRFDLDNLFIRDAGKPFIHFSRSDVPDSPDSLQYWINRGVVEFIPEVSEYHDLDRSDCVILDLDPKDEQFDFDDLRNATMQVLQQVKNWKFFADRLQYVNIRFSGNRSFHLYFWLDQKYDLKGMRKELKTCLDEIETQELTYHNVRDRKNFILIDIGALARHRCVRSLFGVHQKTGRVCVPLLEEEIRTFDPMSATIGNVLAGKFPKTDVVSSCE